MPDDPNPHIVAQLRKMVRGGLKVEEAANELIGIMVPEPEVARARQYLENLMRSIRTRRMPPVLTPSHAGVPWYPGPSPDDFFWPGFRDYLAGKDWDADSLDPLDHSTTRIVSHLGNPAGRGFRVKGLVVGYVQSGKTTNFTAVASKAVDFGYKLVIVLAGVTNQLRSQTQERLAKDLVGPNPDYWHPLTKPDRYESGVLAENGDFRAPNGYQVLVNRPGLNQQKVLCVVKKNGPVLRRLNEWLAKMPKDVLASCPVLIVDDEADQASLNASTLKHLDRRTAINRRLVELLRLLPSVTYLGYTASPFANFLTDTGPDELYPEDFVISIEPGPGYFGPERLFGREALSHNESKQEGIDAIRKVRPDELPCLRPASVSSAGSFQPCVTESLRKATLYFWMATAARWEREGSPPMSSMLIHTTMSAQAHHRIAGVMNGLRDQVLARVRSGDPALLAECETIWGEEVAMVPAAEFGEQAVGFEAVCRHLADVVDRTQMCVENSTSLNRLDYSDGKPVKIVVGGNVVSRGLTIEGLVVSFFVRAANAYDTLLQMGRWFGYRKGYGDLARCWMTDELRDDFFDLATVEEEIRRDIERYDREGVTPRQFAIRVRTHPRLAITAKAKMGRNEVCDISYGGKTIQATVFRQLDKDRVQTNLDAAKKLLSTAVERGCGVHSATERTATVVDSVPASLVLAFLDAYEAHPRNVDFRRDALLRYIRRQLNPDSGPAHLERWRVVVVGQARESLGTVDFGLPEPVPLVRRARLGSEGDPVTEDAVLRAIVADGDFEVHRPADPAEGLLLLYPIAKDSKPSPGSKTRVALNAVGHLVGVALSFPSTTTEKGQSYLVSSLDGLRVALEEEEELPPQDEEDAVAP